MIHIAVGKLCGYCYYYYYYVQILYTYLCYTVNFSFPNLAFDH